MIAQCVQEGSIERMLQAAGVAEERVDATVSEVTAWRITKQGRALVDKRRRRRVQFNLAEIVDRLVNEVRPSACCSRCVYFILAEIVDRLVNEVRPSACCLYPA